MGRAAILTLLLFLAPALRAQQPTPPKEPPAPAVAPANSPADTQDTQAAQVPDQAAAPKLGHPLDPHDVDVLTGKADRDARAMAPRATPYMSVGGYDYGLQGFGRGRNMRLGAFSPFFFGPRARIFPRSVFRVW
jgi:hypothetical protein